MGVRQLGHPVQGVRAAGVPRDPREKLDDAAKVHEFTGVAPTVALHIPWDKVDDYAALARHAEERGLRLGAINSNTFQDDDYRLGSVCHPDAAVRRKAVDHLLECVDIMDATGSKDLKLWFADGTNYPGQDDIRARQDRLAGALAEVYERLGDDQRMLLEYKLFELAVLHDGRPRLGDGVRALPEAGAEGAGGGGHGAPRAGHEHRVHRGDAAAGGEARGFDFNSRFYADDDLMVGAADPFQLFRIMYEVVRGGGLSGDVAFMLDQCHNVESKIPAIVRSVMNVQEATAKALLVDREALAAAQREGDVLGANAVLMDAFNTDVRPLLREVREEMGLDPDPMGAYARSGWAEKIVAERVGGRQAGWGA